MKLIDVLMQTGDRFLQPISISNRDIADNPIVYVNKAFSELTGHYSAQVIGKNCRFLQGPNTDPAGILRIRTALAKREGICQDMLNYTRDGKVFYNRLVLIPHVQDESLFYIGLQHELTEAQFKPVIDISQSDIFDRTVNPLTVLAAAVTFNMPRADEMYASAVTKIRDFVYNL